MAQDKLAELEARIGELEATQSLNIWSFSGILETSYDAIGAKQGATTAALAIFNTPAYDESTNYLRLRFSFNADANVSDRIKFYSRLTTTKFFNTYDKRSTGTGDAPEVSIELGEARSENSSLVYLEKAYADYTFTPGNVLSFGRLPTLDGPFAHYPHGKPRSGTYPALMYNSALDGLAYSHNRNIGGGNFSARVIYTPFSVYNDSSGRIAGFPATLEAPKYNDSKKSNFVDLTSLMLEYSASSSVGNWGLIYQGYQTGKFNINGADLQIPSTGDLTTISLFRGSGTAGFEATAHSLTAEWTNIMNSKLHLGVLHIMTEVKNSGKITFADATAGGSNIYGLGASKEDESLDGSTTLLTARYDLQPNFMIGAEYLAGGKNVFIYDVGADNLTGFYSTPGTGTHAYFIYRPESQLSFRLGWMKQDYKSTPFTFGASKDTDREVTTTYANLRLDF